MDDIEKNEYDKESFRDSIINTLNLDSSILENRINDELFENYINQVLKKELKSKDELRILLNPIIIKLSKIESIYNKYAKDITGLTHKEYIEKLKKVLKQKKNFDVIEEYCLNFTDVDYNNELENYILSLYAGSLLKKKLIKTKDIKWFINYIINFNAKKHNLSFNTIIYEFNFNRKLHLIDSNYYNQINLESDTYSEDIIINLGSFKAIKKIKGFNEALFFLLNSCLLELQKGIQKTKEFSMTYDDNIYRFLKESIIYKEDSNFYDDNKNYFDKEIDLKNEKNKMLVELFNNPLFSEFNFLDDLEIDNNESVLKNTRNYTLVDTYIDSLLLKNPKIIETQPLLKMEYNTDGKRKSIKELIQIKLEKVSFYEEQITAFNELLEEAPTESYRNDINSKLNIIKNGLDGVIRCHNKMIYKALKLVKLSNLEEFVLTISPNELNELESAIIQEKNDFIKKLESNRRKIFKPSSFLENDKYLTREYAKAATYESRLRDIKNKKEI